MESFVDVTGPFLFCKMATLKSIGLFPNGAKTMSDVMVVCLTSAFHHHGTSVWRIIHFDILEHESLMFYN